MKITNEQLSFLKSFRCVRLSKIEKSADWLNTFINDRNQVSKGLVENLKQNGFNEDSEGHIAYYIIISPDGYPCLYFTLQCASLFDAPFDENKHAKKLKLFNYQYNNNVSVTIPKQVIKWVKNLTSKIKSYNIDIQREAGRNVYRVDTIYSSVELVHFCANTNYKMDRNLLGSMHSMGEVFFWFFVVSKIETLQSIAGCKYVHLFAADKSEEGALMTYYTVALNFKREIKLGVTKPYYDFSCFFLSQDISGLLKRRDEYFEHFNLDKEDVVA